MDDDDDGDDNEDILLNIYSTSDTLVGPSAADS